MDIEVNLIFPKTKEGRKALQEKIDDFHAKFVIKKLNELDCSYESKIALLDELKEIEKNKKEKKCC